MLWRFGQTNRQTQKIPDSNKIMTNEQEKRMRELKDRNSAEPRLTTKEELELQELLDLYYDDWIEVDEANC